jgi:RNA polymerase sigma-70 factor (ECF subfamily)
MLRCELDAADAFQAILRVLVRKAGTLRRGDNPPGWLRTVVTRIALRASATGPPHLLEGEAALTADQKTSPPNPHRAPDVDEALADLPGALRLPLTLCYLEGKTGDEAAAELGCSQITLPRWLAEGRELLRRLERLDLLVQRVYLSPATDRYPECEEALLVLR